MQTYENFINLLKQEIHNLTGIHPEIDVEKDLVNIINHAQYWYAKRPVHSVQEALNNLDISFDKAMNKPVSLYKSSWGLQNNSPAFRTFYNQTDMDSFNNASAEEQRKTLLKFVTKYEPTIIRHFKALSDIPRTSGPDTIPLPGELYRKTTDLPAKSSRADRVRNLEDKFGNVLAAEALEHADSRQLGS